MKHLVSHGLATLALSSVALLGCSNDKPTAAEGTAHAAPPPTTTSSTHAPLVEGNSVTREAYGCLLRRPGIASNALEVDCPAPLLRPGEAKPAAQRPAGKENWIRVKPWVYFDAAKKSCAYTPEYFCTPPGTKGYCASPPPPVPVQCTKNAADTALDLSAFVYTDGSGVCHKVAAMTCNTNRRGLCDPPEGEVVKCQ